MTCEMFLRLIVRHTRFAQTMTCCYSSQPFTCGPTLVRNAATRDTTDDFNGRRNANNDGGADDSVNGDKQLSPKTRDLYSGLLRGQRASLARAITLVESTHPEKAEEARKLVTLATRHAKSNGLERSTFRCQCCFTLMLQVTTYL